MTSQQKYWLTNGTPDDALNNTANALREVLMTLDRPPVPAVPDDGLSKWGYDPAAKKLFWPHPYPAYELEKWMDGAQAGHQIIVATTPWEILPESVTALLCRASLDGQITVIKSPDRVEIKRTIP